MSETAVLCFKILSVCIAIMQVFPNLRLVLVALRGRLQPTLFNYSLTLSLATTGMAAL